MTRFASSHLRKTNGKIVVISSSAAWLSLPRMSIYNAQVNIIPIGKVEGCAKAIVSGACQGKRYLTEPAWFKVTQWWKRCQAMTPGKMIRRTPLKENVSPENHQLMKIWFSLRLAVVEGASIRVPKYFHTWLPNLQLSRVWSKESSACLQRGHWLGKLEPKHLVNSGKDSDFRSLGLMPDVLARETGWDSTVKREQFKEVLVALTPNREVVVEDATGEPAGGKAGPAGSGGKKKKKVRRSQKKKATKPNGMARVEDELFRLDEEDGSSSFERVSAFNRLGDPKSKKPQTSAFDRLQDTRSARKGDLRETLKDRSVLSNLLDRLGRATKGDREQRSSRVMEDDHLARFGANVVMYAYHEKIKFRCFHKLPKGSIDKWSDLAHKVLKHFASSQRQKPSFLHLLNVKIQKGGQLREFINRWEKEARDVQGADDQALITMLQAALPQGDVREELRQNPLSTYQEMLARAKYLALEEEDDEPPVRRWKKSGQPVAEGRKRKDFGRGPNPIGYQGSRQLVHAVQSLPAPPQSRKSYSVQDAPKYCEYHRNSTHNTLECVTLKKEMDKLIARGPPPQLERPAPGNRTWRRPAAAAAAITTRDGDLGCQFIMGGNTEEDSASSRKKWKNMVHLAEVQRPLLPKRKKKEPLIFTDEDYPQVLSPHRDALVIKVEINNVVVHRTLVNTSSSVNIMYINTFKELGLSRGDLKPIRTPLSGFTGDTIEGEGTITVKAGVGDGTHRLWLDMEFMVVQLDCANHLILGRPGLEDLECVISPSTCARVDESVSTIYIAIQKEEGRPKAEPAEEVEEVTLDPTKSEQKVKVVKKLTPYFQAHPVHVLSQIPIGTLLRSPNAPSRVGKWGVFLGSFQIEFKPRPAIKGHALADVMVECTAREVESNEEEPKGNWWTMYTDGSSATHASGGGVVAISPEGFKAYYSVRFQFKVSNNEAEYEALLYGLRLAASLKAERIQVRDTALELLKAFEAYRIEPVSREENAEADILSKLGPDSPDHIKAMTQEEELLEPSISLGQVLVITLSVPDWIDELTMYILDESLPTDPVAAQFVKRRAPSYMLECGRLYKRLYNGTLLRTQFEAEWFNEFLQSWGIKHSYTAVGYPQTNGQVENTNCTIVDGLKKKIMECKSAWVEDLPYILWTYKTTPRKATGETPFVLTYGFEARAPAETSLLSYRVETFDAQENEENLRAELHLIDTRRERAYIRAENGGKFSKSFEGPNIIKEVLADGAVKMQTPAGGDVPRVDSDIKVFITSVYGKHSYIDRRILWKDIEDHFVENDLWLVAGDFNAILSHDDHQGLSLPDSLSMEEFSQCMDLANLSPINPDSNTFTWTGIRGRGQVWRRIDWVFVNPPMLQHFESITLQHLSKTGSDHCPLLLKCSTFKEDGPKPFRYINAWANNSSFLPLIDKFWNDNPNYGGMLGLHQKFKRLKVVLKAWNKESFGNIFSNLSQAEEKAKTAENIFSSDPTSANRQSLYKAHAELQYANINELSYWKQKSHLNWMELGDRNSKFFQSYVKGRRHLLKIRKIKGENGRCIEDTEGIKKAAVEHFSKVFSATSTQNISEILKYIPLSISVEDNNFLTALPDNEEVKDAVWALNPNSAPGPDGFNGDFFRKTWHIIGNELCMASKEFFLGIPVPTGYGATWPPLIPKKEDAASFEDYRPISLSTFLSKINTKILASRKLKVLPKIISDQQIAFQKGKDIADHILMVEEMYHEINRKVEGESEISSGCPTPFLAFSKLLVRGSTYLRVNSTLTLASPHKHSQLRKEH
ncbi:unnamed protein product [Cuscuta campestris]|uniref:Integrase catalytic domain-containing protein n=1 Tax=Cuscuta campestris TaxID=132261 RepID=A0A484KJ99_9ASTE|nr:unnamed protein product [Cuscuta campestris]